MEEGEVCDLKWTEVKGEVCDLNINGKITKRRKGRRKSTAKRSTMKQVSPRPLCKHATAVPKQPLLYRSFSSARSLALKTRDTMSGLSVAVWPSRSASVISGQAGRG